MPNRLAHESSPYLRQHADNPVDWYPWGPEALERARAEDRPLLLSVGYSSCHWCHVMERESFEDDVVAARMNKHFVNVKVDREERPDIDQIYMRAVQAMTGRGGWPMTVFLTPRGVPFYGGTYFPPEPRHGMPSFIQVIDAVAHAWNERREQVESGGAKLLDALRASAKAGAPASVGTDDLDRTYHGLASRYDPRHGGFGQAPKFPQPVTLELVLRQHLRTGDPRPLEMCVHTLRRMAAGGLKDHLAGGFHRYSVDARWLVPHFEKMLYDNALLARLYLDAYRVTGEDDLREIAEETLDYLLADMRAPTGGFYAARDADSEGVEGKFYVWSPDEVRAVLDSEAAELFCAAYDVTTAGNFEGKSILHLPLELSRIAEEHGIAETDLRSRMSEARAALLASRSRREEPFRDEKIIVAWNGFAIRALAEAGAALGRPDYVGAAEDAARFLWRALRVDERLLHSWMGGPSDVGAFLDDHAALGNALLSLHGATLDARWFDAATWLAESIVERFWDEGSRTIYDTPADGEPLIVRPRDASDTATPSGPSLAAELFARLARTKGDDRWKELARAVIEREAESIRSFGSAFGRMLSVVDRLDAEPVEIAIVGSADQATRSLIRAAHARTLRNAVVVGDRDDDPTLDSPLLAHRERTPGRATAYVCRNFACELPASTPDEVADRIASLSPG